MKFAHFSHVWNKPGMTAAQRYQQLWRELALCDELGFDFAFSVEHHFHPDESWMPCPSIYCATGAMVTRRLRLGPMGYIVPLYDPLRIVEEAAVLDNVLSGRLELGLVAGIIPYFFSHYRADFENRRALTAEALTLIKTAFAADGPFSFEGLSHQYKDVTLSVKPLQRPWPPIWIQSREPDTLQLLAREGVHTGYLFLMPRGELAPRYREYLRMWRDAGHAHRPNIAYWIPVYVDETDERAAAKAAPHLAYAFTKVWGGPSWNAVEVFRKRGEFFAAEIFENITDLNYLLKRNLVFVGSPETVAKQIREAAEEGSFNSVFAEFNLGYLDEEDLMRSIRLFGTRVIPALRDFEPY